MHISGHTPEQLISYYDVLQIASNATDAQVKQAYHTLAKKLHPDRNPSDRRMAELRFRLINEAYANLKTRDKRERYNRILRKQGRKYASTLKAQNDNDRTEVAARGFFSAIAHIFWPQDIKGTEGR